MRHLDTFNNEEIANNLYIILLKEDIKCTLEEASNGKFDLWVTIEDQYEKAKEIYENYKADPSAYDKSLNEMPPPSKEKVKKYNLPPLPKGRERGQKKVVAKFYAPLTRILIMTCISIYLFSVFTTPKLEEGQKPGFFPSISSFQADLLYDFPDSISLGEELNTKYGVASRQDLQNLPPEGLEILEKMNQEPIWGGFYNVLIHWQEREHFFKAPLFGDISKGELWRLITPIFLHAGILHILFNMLWLFLLGKMLEQNMGLFRMVCFIIITAIITNTLQYLMSGPLFMGFSGVISAMAGYVWTRKKDAPWEIYQIDRSSLIFLWIFIFGLLALQIVAFCLRIFNVTSISLQIANTAHVSGVLFGMCLAKIKFFHRRA